MKIKVIGIEKYLDNNQKMKVRIILKSNTLTISCEVIWLGEKIGEQQVIDIIMSEMKYKEKDIHIPPHIKDTLK